MNTATPAAPTVPIPTFKAGQRVFWERTKQKGTFLGLGSHGATVDFGPGRNGGIKQYLPLEELRIIRERGKKS